MRDVVRTLRIGILGRFCTSHLSGHPRVGPCVFVDYMGPMVLELERGIDGHPHPCIDLGTVTFLWSELITHRDTLGPDGRLGDVVDSDEFIPLPE